MTTLLHDLEVAMAARMLKYAVGRAIFCPVCETVLDCRRAVLFEGTKTAVVCATCYDRDFRARVEVLVKAYQAAVALRDVQLTLTGDHPDPLKVEVTDGRTCDWALEEVFPQ